MGRKNAKSAICAVLALGHLVGPLRHSGLAAAPSPVALAEQKPAELRGQIEAIAIGERRWTGLRFRRSPYPGKCRIRDRKSSKSFQVIEPPGMRRGFDLVVIDETGLMPERSRELLAGLAIVGERKRWPDHPYQCAGRQSALPRSLDQSREHHAHL